MASPSDNLICYIRRLAIHAAQPEDTDSALLGRFIANRDEGAFAALVDRHAALVFQVCRRILDNAQDAQDAFQATFLVLARRAATVRPPEALPAWLHGVARRVALKTRSARLRHQRVEKPLSAALMDSRPDPLRELAARDFLAIVDEEVRRLAEVYRLPVILCCLEGRTIEEAARQLGWTMGSVKGRLERGRARLHQRLVRRGLTLSAALAAVELSRGAASAHVAAGHAAAFVAVARNLTAQQTSGTAAVSARAGVLAQDVLKSMALAKLKMAATLTLATCLLIGGFLAHRHAHFLPRTDGEALSSTTPPANAPIRDAALGKNEEDGNREKIADRVEVTGRVLDPKGRPLAGARLYVGYVARRYEPDAVAHLPIYPLRASSGADGRFHFSFARSDLDERYLDASRPVVIATAAGFGADWVEIGGSPAAWVNLKLVEDFPLEGRILDAQRTPVAGAKVFVRNLRSNLTEGTPDSVPGLNGGPATSKSCWGPLPGQPQHVTTAADGQFRFTGLGGNRHVTLVVEGPGIPTRSFGATTRPSANVPAGPQQMPGSPVEFVAPAPRSIRGVVREKTGQAISGVKICVQPGDLSTGTDKDGRYELLVHPGARQFIVMAQAPSDQLYFAATVRLSNTPNLDHLTADFELIRGIPLRGRVTDKATGKPPKRAVVEYHPLFPNPHCSALTLLEHLQAASVATLQADGSYCLPVFPGPGAVLVAASPRDSYANAWLDEQELAKLFPDGGNRSEGSWLHGAAGAGFARRRCVDRYNALSLIQPDEKAKSLSLDLTVQSARPLLGTVVGPDGKPLAGAAVCGLTSMPDAEWLQGASFAVEGLNPRLTRSLSFWHEEKGLGKVLEIRGDESKVLRVQLEPCGVATGRLVDKAGKPVQGEYVTLSTGGNGLFAFAESDREGHFRAALIPRLPYKLGISPRLPTSPRLLRPVDALVESGQTKDLGDLIVGN